MFDSIRNEHVFLFFFPSIYLSALDKSDNRVQVVDIHPGPQLFWFPCLFTSHEVCKSSALFLCALRSFRCVRERFGGATMCSVGFRVSFYYMSDAARHRRCRKATKTEDYATPGERLGGSWARGRGGRETKLDYTTSHCRGPCVQYNNTAPRSRYTQDCRTLGRQLGAIRSFYNIPLNKHVRIAYTFCTHDKTAPSVCVNTPRLYNTVFFSRDERSERFSKSWSLSRACVLTRS